MRSGVSGSARLARRRDDARRASPADSGTLPRRRSQSSAALTAMRCNQVVNAARPSKRPRLRQTLIIASCTASSASSVSSRTRIASESSFGRASASNRSSAAPAPVWAAATSSPMSGAGAAAVRICPGGLGRFCVVGDGSSGWSAASSNLRRVGIATRRPSRCGVRRGALAAATIAANGRGRARGRGNTGRAPAAAAGPRARRATRAQRPGDPRASCRPFAAG